VQESSAPLTLVIHADKSVTYEKLLHLTLLARASGIHEALLATLPRLVEGPSARP
jgi:biopolymer transport protein ExbD